MARWDDRWEEAWTAGFWLILAIFPDRSNPVWFLRPDRLG